MNHDRQTLALLKKIKSMDQNEVINLCLPIREISSTLWFHWMSLFYAVKSNLFDQENQARLDVDIHDAFLCYVETPVPTYSSYNDAEANLLEKITDAELRHKDRKMVDDECSKEQSEQLCFAQEDKYARSDFFLFEDQEGSWDNEASSDVLDVDEEPFDMIELPQQELDIVPSNNSCVTKIDYCLTNLFLDEVDELINEERMQSLLDEQARVPRLTFTFTPMSRRLWTIPEREECDDVDEECSLFKMTSMSY